MIQCFGHVSAILVIIMMTSRTKKELDSGYYYIYIYEKMFAA